MTGNRGLAFGPRQLHKMAYICEEFEKLDRVTPNETRKVEIMPGYEHVDVHMIF